MVVYVGHDGVIIARTPKQTGLFWLVLGLFWVVMGGGGLILDGGGYFLGSGGWWWVYFC